MDESILSEKSQKAMAFVNAKAHDITSKSRGKAWEDNTRANRKFFQEGNATLRGLTAYIVGAGPSLEKNGAELRNVGKLGVIVCVDAALRYLLSVGVKPDYCLAIDSGDRCLRFTEGLDTKDITLVCMTSSSPAVIAAWQGPRYFVQGNAGSGDAADKMFAMTQRIVARRSIKEGEEVDAVADMEMQFPGVVASVNCGGNVTTAAWSFAFEILRAVKIIFVGADYSWHDRAFYAGNDYLELAKERQTVEGVLSHPDLNDCEVHTNLSLFSFKGWHEARAIQCVNTHVNATEGGILGIGDGPEHKGRRLPGWEFMTLKDAIAKYTPRVEEPCLL